VPLLSRRKNANGFSNAWETQTSDSDKKWRLSAAQIESIYKAGSLGVCKGAVLTNPAQETFAAEAVDTTSSPKTVTVVNNRDAVLDLDGFTFTGKNPGDFAESTTTCTSSLAARKSCQVSITFTPQSTRKRSATLNVNDSNGGSPQTVAFSGTGKD
jgi:hypothetical protein